MPSSAPAFSLQFFFFFFFYHFFSLLPAMAAMAALAGDPSPLLLLPPISTSPPSDPVPIPTTIPAFPEQSAISSACPLRPPDRLLPAVSAACSSAGSTSSSHCCPVLAAWLYAAYAPTALSLAPLPAAAAAGGGGGGGPGDLPLLPDDSESCAAAAARALRSRGGGLASSLLPRIDSCNVRLRRPSCPRPSASSSSSASASAQWSPPSAAAARRLLRSCSAPGLASCSRCLRALNQLKAEATAVGGNATAAVKSKAVGGARGRDCQIMGLTWLLAKNGIRYLPAAAAVLRTFMAADEAAAAAEGGGKEVDPTTCSVDDDDDDMPLAVDSAQINGHDKSFTVPSFSTPSSSIVPFLVLGLGLTLF